MEKSFLLNVFDNNYVLLYRKVELRKKTNRKANMTKRQTYIIALAITCCILVAIGMTLHFGRKASTPPAPTPKPNIVAKEKPQPKDTIKKVKPVVKKQTTPSAELLPTRRGTEWPTSSSAMATPV